MDLVSLLNSSAKSKSHDPYSTDQDSQSMVTGKRNRFLTDLPTPSPERTLAQREVDVKRERGRTPWNAGGYSLPLSIHDKPNSNSSLSPRSQSESLESETSNDTVSIVSRDSRHGSLDWFPNDAPSLTILTPPLKTSSTRTVTIDSEGKVDISGACDKEDTLASLANLDEYPARPFGSLTHKFSDSHSSLSSYSSSKSTSHSRISSVTTVSGAYISSPSYLEIPSLESALEKFKETTFIPVIGEAQPPSPLEQVHLSASGAGRSVSISDGALHMPAVSRLRITTPEFQQSSNKPGRLLTAPRTHKRAISAPGYSVNLPSLGQTGERYSHAAFGAPLRARMDQLGGTKSTSDLIEESPIDIRQEPHNTEITDNMGYKSHRNPTLSTSQSIPSLLENVAHVSDKPAEASSHRSTVQDDDEEGHCMFVKDCDTGSQLRKAISHLFGRNKACTLKIPKHVWVYYCRKHYQRIRYRNARTYPVNQMELVKVQIKRLQAWSFDNRQRGSGPYISSWTLSLRKREKNRIDNERETGEEGDEDNSAARGGTAVPEWLIQQLGSGYTTEQILDAAERLHQEIASGTLSQVPEIEFLPDIIDDEEPNSAKPTRSRSKHNRSVSSSNAPKRKALDVPQLPSHYPTVFEATQSNIRREGAADEHELVSPSGKRARIGTTNAVSYGHPSRLPALPTLSGPQSGYYVRDEIHLPPSTMRGPQVPRRAPSIVPRIRPLEYSHRPARPEEPVRAYSYGEYPRYEPQERSFIAENQDMASYRFNSGYTGFRQQQLPDRVDNIRDRSSSEIRLPPISTHLPGNFENGHPDHGETSRAAVYGATFRPAHQRSASAFTPISRTASNSTRPSSSGGEAQDDLTSPNTSGRGISPYVVGAHSQPQGQRHSPNGYDADLLHRQDHIHNQHQHASPHPSTYEYGRQRIQESPGLSQLSSRKFEMATRQAQPETQSVTEAWNHANQAFKR